MRKTIRNVTIVVPVLITSCHVSLYPKTGPAAAQAMTVRTAMPNVVGLAEAFAVHRAKAGNHAIDFLMLIGPSWKLYVLLPGFMRGASGPLGLAIAWINQPTHIGSKNTLNATRNCPLTLIADI
jgi:hypothetical protein